MRNTNIFTVLTLAVVIFFLAIVSALAAKKKDTGKSKNSIPAVSKTAASQPDNQSDKPQEIVFTLENSSQPEQVSDTDSDDYSDTDNTAQDDTNSPLSFETKICCIAKDFIGTPYRWGGTSPQAFDCSGFTRYVYSKVGIHIPRTAREQFKKGKRIKKGRWEGGDLVFFNMNKGYVSHVGMYLGALCFIHASNPRCGVKIDNLCEKSYKTHYVGARRYAFT